MNAALAFATALFVMGCGRVGPTHGVDTNPIESPIAYDRAPRALGFDGSTEPRSAFVVYRGSTKLWLSLEGDLLAAITGGWPGCPENSSVDRTEPDNSSLDVLLTYRWALLDQIQCGQNVLGHRDIQSAPVPGQRILVRRTTASADCMVRTPEAANSRPQNLVFRDLSSRYTQPDGDETHEPQFADGVLIERATDGSLRWRGVTFDELGRPTDIWVERPELVLNEYASEKRQASRFELFEERAQRPPEDYPLRPTTANLRLAERLAAIRLRWYPHVEHPFEVWSEADGLAEGLYVAFADDGTPLVTGDHVRGTRHGLWYYFGWRGQPRHQTIVQIDDYFLGHLEHRWKAPDLETDPLESLVDPFRR